MSEAVTIPASTSTAEPEPVVISRNAVLLGVLGFGAVAIGLAYFVRAVSGGSPGDWFLAAVLAIIAVPYLWMLASAGSPLLVADETGIRIRLGGQWRGLLWEDMAKVNVHPRTGFLRDGRVVIEPGEDQPIEAGLIGVGRLAAAVNTRFYGKPLAVSYGFTTAASSADMTAALTELSAGRASVSEVEETPVLIDASSDSWAADNWEELDAEAEVPGSPSEFDAEGEVPGSPSEFDAEGEVPGSPSELDAEAQEPVPPPGPDDVDADLPDRLDPISPAVSAARSTRPALRAEITKPSEPTPTVSVGALALSSRVDGASGRDLPEEPELRRSGAGSESLDIDPDASAPSTADPVDDEPTEDLPPADVTPPADEWPGTPLAIGMMIGEGRSELGLSIDELAARTRIRPHVIESIERDDFVPCGGDFYARGHLRTLARALGIDETELIARYNDEYATEPINPRVVFEAELATGPAPTLGRTTGGPKWGAMVAVVLLVLMAWGVIRLLVGGDHSLNIEPPVVNGSGGIASPGPAGIQAPHATVRLRAAYGDSLVTARSAGQVLYKGRLNAGTTKVIRAKHAIHLTMSDGGAVLVTTNGTFRRTLGDPGERVQTMIRPNGDAGQSGQRSAG